MTGSRTPGAGSDELASRWSQLHHDIDPHRVPLLFGWLRLMWAGGRVLDRARVPPTAVTVTGVCAAVGALAVARDHPLAACGGVAVAALCDGLDGATAVVGGRASRSGAIADAIADRVCDGTFALVLWRRGAPGWSAGTAAALAWGVDALRRRRRIPARITVAERPTFTICAALACAAAPDVAGTGPARAGAAVWIGAGAAGIVQLLRTPALVRRVG